MQEFKRGGSRLWVKPSQLPEAAAAQAAFTRGVWGHALLENLCCSEASFSEFLGHIYMLVGAVGEWSVVSWAMGTYSWFTLLFCLRCYCPGIRFTSLPFSSLSTFDINIYIGFSSAHFAQIQRSSCTILPCAWRECQGTRLLIQYDYRERVSAILFNPVWVWIVCLYYQHTTTADAFTNRSWHPDRYVTIHRACIIQSSNEKHLESA